MKKAFLSIVLITIASCSFAQWTTSGINIYNSNTGYVGVGTANPQALLDVGKEINGGAVGTVLARQSEGDGTGTGTSLNAKAWETQFTNFNGKSFSLEHSFYGLVNSSINFYRGASQTGGYMAFATNNGKEQMVIAASGSVGIGTTNPLTSLDVKLATNEHIQFAADVNSAKPGASGIICINDANTAYTPLGFYASNYYFGLGNVGVGTTGPQSKLHVLDNGSSSNASGQYSGNLIVQGNSGGRTMTIGSSLEFVIPANTDGSNPWGQARIITVAGNANNGDATGKLILGTRRLFEKGTGTGVTWNYGDDLTIDGNGFIGINTSDTKGYRFAVNGSAIATSMTVKLNQSWPDYVFKKDYQLPSLTEVKTYIDQNHHLPEMPSEQEVIKDGINLGEMNKLLTEKVEELMLYMIRKDEQITKQQEQIDELKEQLKRVIKCLPKH